MFSKSCEYAIKAIVFVALHQKDESCVGVKEIAKGINSPEAFIAKILQGLSKNKIISSIKGPKGGYYLTPIQIKRPIIEIVSVIDGEDLLKACVLGLEQCSNENPCPMHNEYQKIKKSITKMLENNTIEDLYKTVSANKAVLLTNPMYLYNTY